MSRWLNAPACKRVLLCFYRKCLICEKRGQCKVHATSAVRHTTPFSRCDRDTSHAPYLPDDMTTLPTHAASHSLRLLNRFELPPQPPYRNSRQAPTSLSKCQRTKWAVQGPGDAASMHTSISASQSSGTMRTVREMKQALKPRMLQWDHRYSGSDADTNRVQLTQVCVRSAPLDRPLNSPEMQIQSRKSNQIQLEEVKFTK